MYEAIDRLRDKIVEIKMAIEKIEDQTTLALMDLSREVEESKMEYKVTKVLSFSAAHHLPGHNTCGKVHGHNYKVHVSLYSEELNEEGMVFDFAFLKSIVQGFINRNFDHKDLNVAPAMIMEYDKKYCIPTAENIARVICKYLDKELKAYAYDHITKVSVKVEETDTCIAEVSMRRI